MLMSFYSFIKQDPIMFCLSQDRDDDAMELIEKVYHDSEDKSKILEMLKQQV